AILIGIDGYCSSPLCSCATDIEKMKNFLTVNLGVPKDHIQRDYDTTAPPTHKNIVEMLLNISTNPKIQHGDNIIIYFSGHGSSYFCLDFYPQGSLEATGTVEALCPIDHSPCDSSNISVPNISDRELNIILSEISHTKGHHITCILDCCHSSGVARGPRTRWY
ncbi:hypothetical protein ARMGADRAFT_946040, partial [Armillaria gallica]